MSVKTLRRRKAKAWRKCLMLLSTGICLPLILKALFGIPCAAKRAAISWFRCLGQPQRGWWRPATKHRSATCPPPNLLAAIREGPPSFPRKAALMLHLARMPHVDQIAPFAKVAWVSSLIRRIPGNVGIAMGRRSIKEGRSHPHCGTRPCPVALPGPHRQIGLVGSKFIKRLSRNYKSDWTFLFIGRNFS